MITHLYLTKKYLWWWRTWDECCNLWHLKVKNRIVFNLCRALKIIQTWAHISASPSFHSREGPSPNPWTRPSVAAAKRTRSSLPIAILAERWVGLRGRGFIWPEYKLGDKKVHHLVCTEEPTWWKSTHSRKFGLCCRNSLHLWQHAVLYNVVPRFPIVLTHCIASVTWVL